MKTKIIFSAETSPLYDQKLTVGENHYAAWNLIRSLYDKWEEREYLYLHEFFDALQVSWEPYLTDRRRRGFVLFRDDEVFIEGWPNRNTNEVNIVINTGKDAEKLAERDREEMGSRIKKEEQNANEK